MKSSSSKPLTEKPHSRRAKRCSTVKCDSASSNGQTQQLSGAGVPNVLSDVVLAIRVNASSTASKKECKASGQRFEIVFDLK